MNTFTNKVAVITGGNSGIGLATAKELSSRGLSRQRGGPGRPVDAPLEPGQLPGRFVHQLPPGGTATAASLRLREAVTPRVGAGSEAAMVRCAWHRDSFPGSRRPCPAVPEQLAIGADQQHMTARPAHLFLAIPRFGINLRPREDRPPYAAIAGTGEVEHFPHELCHPDGGRGGHPRPPGRG